MVYIVSLSRWGELWWAILAVGESALFCNLKK